MSCNTQPFFHNDFLDIIPIKRFEREVSNTKFMTEQMAASQVVIPTGAWTN